VASSTGASAIMLDLALNGFATRTGQLDRVRRSMCGMGRLSALPLLRHILSAFAVECASMFSSPARFAVRSVTTFRISELVAISFAEPRSLTRIVLGRPTTLTRALLMMV
jgi:hypothetical protein